MSKRVHKNRKCQKKSRKGKYEEPTILPVESDLDKVLLNSLIQHKRKNTPAPKDTYNMQSYSTVRFCNKKGV